MTKDDIAKVRQEYIEYIHSKISKIYSLKYWYEATHGNPLSDDDVIAIRTDTSTPSLPDQVLLDIIINSKPV